MITIAKNAARRALSATGFNPVSIAQAIESLKIRSYRVIDGQIPDKLMVNIGGTQFYKRDWRILDFANPENSHYDFFYFGGPDYDFDLLCGEPLPFSDNSVSFFYSAHTFEHLLAEVMPHLYAELYRCLKPGGAARIQVPNLRPHLDAFIKDDRSALFNMDGGYSRFDLMAKIYGKEYAEKTLKGWPKNRNLLHGPFGDQETVDALMNVFASHLKGRVSYDDVLEKARSMSLEDFGDYHTRDIQLDWKRRNPIEHSTWNTPERIINWFQNAKFSDMYETKPFESRFEEMRGLGKYWGFDYRYVDGSCFVEAVK